MSTKKFVTKFLGTKGVSSILSSQNKKSPLVLLYHGVTKDNERHGIQNYRGKHVTASAFEQHLVWLQKHFEIVPLKNIEELATNRTIPKRALCAITFDDGYKNNYEAAYPLLKKYDLPATIFITTGFIEKDIALWPDILEESIGSIPRSTFSITWNEGVENYPSRTRGEKIAADLIIRDRLKKLSHDARLVILLKLMNEAGVTKETVLNRKDYAPLSWSEIEEMSQNRISFGAHTHNHPILARLEATQQKTEIERSVHILKEHGINAPHFAYPNGQSGDYSPETIEIVRELGFPCAWTTGGMRIDTIHDNLFELPRITFDNTEDMARFRALASNAIPFLKKIIHERPARKSN